jgi:flagellar biosynthesis/type III secretory pathway protein FliH
MPREAGVVVETYTYLAGSEPDASPPSWSDLKEIHGEAGSGRTCAIAEAVPGNRNPLQTRQANDAELQQRFELGRRQGCEEGRKVEREAHDVVRLAEERRHKEQIVSLAEKFAAERDLYFHEVEHEVVELALAVAARILRRESLMDSLLLTGAVRIALGQLSKTTKVRLHVPAAEIDLWTEAIAHLPNLPLKPDVLAGDGMQVGDCVIKTELGSVDLGICAQLREIERGFFDRAEWVGSEAEVHRCEPNPDVSDSA